MNYSLRIKKSASKTLGRIEKTERLRLIDAIDRLRTEPTAGSALKGEFAGLRRLRVGPYRIIYEVFNRELLILAVRIGHRGSVYR